MPIELLRGPRHGVWRPAYWRRHRPDISKLGLQLNFAECILCKLFVPRHVSERGERDLVEEPAATTFRHDELDQLTADCAASVVGMHVDLAKVLAGRIVGCVEGDGRSVVMP